MSNDHALAAPGQTPHSCRALAADLRSRASAQSRMAELAGLPRTAELHHSLGRTFIRAAERWERTAAALASQGAPA